MDISPRRAQKFLVVVVACLVVLWLLLWTLFITVGHSLIVAGYERRLPIGFLNQIIQGQDFHEVQFYISYADSLFIRTSSSVAGLLIALCTIFLVSFVPPQKFKTAFLIFLSCTVLLFTADRIFGGLLHLQRNHERVFDERVVRLRKFSPGLDTTVRPNDDELSNTDGLLPDSFRLRTDGRGFIMPTVVHPDSDLRVFFVGGSTTETKYVHENNRFPFATGRILEELTGLRINAYNAGYSGNNSLHSLNIIINDILPLRPDIIVLMHNINDLVALLYTGTYWNDNFSRSPIKRIYLRLDTPSSLHSLVSGLAEWIVPHLYAKLQSIVNPAIQKIDEWHDIRGKTLRYDTGQILKEFSANLRTFVAVCRARGITPVLMTQQNRFTLQPEAFVANAMRQMKDDFGIGYSEFFTIYAMANDEIRARAAKSEVMLIDMDKKIPKSSEFIYDTIHLNDKGSRLAARFIADSLRKSPKIASMMARKGIQLN